MGLWTKRTWLSLAAAYGAAEVGQAVVPITGPLGWLEYLSKHASRGVAHYQRQGTPPGWTKTGRLWGHGGSWPVVEPVEAVITDVAMRRVRRLVRSWARVAWARRVLRCNDRGLSAVRGMSEWVPGSVLLQFAVLAGWSGELKASGLSEG